MRRAKPAHRGKQDGEDGFALAEVLVAFAILALVSIAMMRAFGGTTATIKAVAAREAALDLATNLLERARAEDPLQAGRREGREGNLVWWREAAPVDGAGLPPSSGSPRLFRVEIGVTAAGARASRAPLLTSLVLAKGDYGG